MNDRKRFEEIHIKDPTTLQFACMHMHSKLGKTEEPFLLGSYQPKLFLKLSKPFLNWRKNFFYAKSLFLGLRKCQIKVTL